jgi:N-acetylmuramic acid 6-phosphate etherase
MDRSHLPTEQALPDAAMLDTLSATELVRRMNEQDRLAVEAVAKVADDVAKAAELVADRLGRGGRLFYFGAGTSGRLGVLDASECPPTFRTDPRQVQGIIAGGREAMFVAQEGAEDDETAGEREAETLGIDHNDIAFGIAAGGTTPFVRGTLTSAHKRGAATVFLACVPPGPGQASADVEIRPITGPELVRGSTRLKAGTATKLVLNQVTTTAMILLGKTYGDRMVDLKASNVKLRDRATRLVAELCEVDRSKAEATLDAAGGHVKLAVVMHRLGLDADQAASRLADVGGRLRRVLEEADDAA